MSLADLSADAPITPATQGPACTVCDLLADLQANDPASFERLDGWLRDRRARYSVIAALVRTHLGEDIQDSTYSRHARGKCRSRERMR